MERLYKPWETDDCAFGNVAVLVFLFVQCLDGIFTYLGVKSLGVGVEANPLVSSAVAYAGLAPGLAAAKLLASGFGIVLHLRRVHNLLALLTIFYVAVAIIPWVLVLVGQ